MPFCRHDLKLSPLLGTANDPNYMQLHDINFIQGYGLLNASTRCATAIATAADGDLVCVRFTIDRLAAEELSSTDAHCSNIRANLPDSCQIPHVLACGFCSRYTFAETFASCVCPSLPLQYTSVYAVISQRAPGRTLKAILETCDVNFLQSMASGSGELQIFPVDWEQVTYPSQPNKRTPGSSFARSVYKHPLAIASASHSRQAIFDILRLTNGPLIAATCLDDDDEATALTQSLEERSAWLATLDFTIYEHDDRVKLYPGDARFDPRLFIWTRILHDVLRLTPDNRSVRTFAGRVLVCPPSSIEKFHAPLQAQGTSLATDSEIADAIDALYGSGYEMRRSFQGGIDITSGASVDGCEVLEPQAKRQRCHDSALIGLESMALASVFYLVHTLSTACHATNTTMFDFKADNLLVHVCHCEEVCVCV